MRTEDLIVGLAARSGAVVPLPSPAVRWARWMLVALLAAVVMVIAQGARADVWQAWQRPSFALAAVCLLVGGAASAWMTLRMAVPARQVSAAWDIVPVAANVAWVLTVAPAGAWHWPDLSREPIHVACAINIALTAAVPAWVLFVMVQRGMPMNPVRNAVLASLAALGFGAIAAQVMCPIDRPMHLFLWHVLPVQVFGGIGAWLVGAWFRRGLRVHVPEWPQL